jgi:hypothetical protein
MDTTEVARLRQVTQAGGGWNPVERLRETLYGRANMLGVTDRSERRQAQQARATRSTGNVLSTAKERVTYLRSMAAHAAGNGTLAVSTRGGGWRASSENHQARSAPQPSPAGSGS